MTNLIPVAVQDYIDAIAPEHRALSTESTDSSCRHTLARR
jgi:hypothetical protein